ncbi:hypothetical protein FJ976_09790 [Mesorhizobium sp. B1-1-9]|uniref:hypothetical protein n=1 Tax=Mesorhizobium sp. B1-1-9 TaxID=2589975 RepID=UPI00112C843C|nr:hypothetical protein [Mesorhizobium sp. B1-1-9]TPN54479.1 hypothetical protein FJ976_09790 [Mesorhizobium sp. B1-1-9]
MGKTPATIARARILGEQRKTPKGVAKLRCEIVASNWEFMRDLVFGNKTKRSFMEPFKHTNFLRILAFPRMVGDFKYETSAKDLFFRLSDAKENHGILIGRVLLDNVNKKFWIESGAYRNITTFKAKIVESEGDKFIHGSFVNSGTWISYPALILAFFGWVCLLVSNKNASDMVFYLVFFAFFHLGISISFNNRIKNILTFLANELDVHPSQREIISNHS